MKRLIPLILFCTPFCSSAQFMEQKKATHARTATATAQTVQETWMVDFEKPTLTWFQIDSVKTIANKKKISFGFYKVVMTTTKSDVEWTYNPVTKDSTAGLFQLKVRKVPPRAKGVTTGADPENEKADFSKGLIIYCTDNRKPREIKVESFFELTETEQR
jgi:hypothetical protein